MVVLKQCIGLLLILLSAGMTTGVVALLFFATSLVDLLVAGFVAFVAFLPLSVGYRWAQRPD